MNQGLFFSILSIFQVFLLPQAFCGSRIEIYRHGPQITQCASALIATGRQLGDGIDFGVEPDHGLEHAPVQRALPPYFAKMTELGSLTPDQVQYYTDLTHNSAPQLLTFFLAYEDTKRGSVSTTTAGQFRGKPYHLPFELEFLKLGAPQPLLDRRTYPLVWESGRTLGGSQFNAIRSYISLSRAAEAFYDLRRNEMQKSADGYIWTSLASAIDRGTVFVHAISQGHRDLYTAAPYHYKEFREFQSSALQDSNTSANGHNAFQHTGTHYILTQPLKQELQNFGSFNTLEDTTSIGAKLEKPTEAAFETYLNLRSLSAPHFFDYNNRGQQEGLKLQARHFEDRWNSQHSRMVHPSREDLTRKDPHERRYDQVQRDGMPHYYPRAISITERTTHWRKMVDTLLQKEAGISLKKAETLFDLRTFTERNILSPILESHTLESVFQTSSLFFVDLIGSDGTLNHCAVGEDDLDQFLAAIYLQIRNQHSEWNDGEFKTKLGDSHVVMSLGSASLFLSSLRRKGFQVAQNPLTMPEIEERWSRHSRTRWFSKASGRDRSQFAALFLKTRMMLHPRGHAPYHFYRTDYDYPVFEEYLLHISINELSQIAINLNRENNLTPSQSVLFNGYYANSWESAINGGL